MKRIVKQESPDWFENWKETFRNVEHREPHYKGDFSTDDADGALRRKRLKEELIKEQGYLCCYCMMRIHPETSHIEHFWPKEKEFKDMDLEYDNLYASCNGENSISLEEEHCGHRKNNWWIPDMIPPSSMDIESLFHYTPDGKIHSAKGQRLSYAAQEMIRNLGLDHFHPERNRRRAIEASEVYDEEDYTEEDIRSFIDYYSHMEHGKYVPYCKAITDCLRDMI